ncbi:E2F-associated phosphoprotein isoform X2 [Nerophis lumbriciformis]|uniref:E2F-associated phosphoprotein isoform X2 n=1 Tax=Nerophis lumbriciformis TaxID=546530 RepID=UPI002AE0A6F5|nr:E2F-associated phosphoprotein-like isoform X2 [Nerophis lumbriciformis]
MLVLQAGEEEEAAIDEEERTALGGSSQTSANVVISVVFINKMDKVGDVDSYEIEEPSDEERAASSSEDELDVLLSGTPEQKKKLIREYLTGESESSSGDEFQKEMEAELSSTIKTMEDTWGPTCTTGSVVANPPMYDKIYFDSDSDQEDDQPSSSSGRRRAQRVILTNDELLYDPDEDERDQAWVDARRRRYNRKRPSTAANGRRSQAASLPSSDAVLNCPACMTTLCLDCQRHDKYRTQYRAMFVMNCTVRKDQVLRYQGPTGRKPRGRKRRKAEDETPERVPERVPVQVPERVPVQVPEQAPQRVPAGMDADEVYRPVCCSECSTEVAVMDKDEVYHFFNILSSHC